MNKKEVTEFFADLSDQEKAAFLCRLSYELTISARETYTPGSEGLDDPVLMREINEVQHRILSHASQLSRSEKSREYSGEYEAALWHILFDSDNEGLKRALKNAVSKVLTQFAPVLV